MRPRFILRSLSLAVIATIMFAFTTVVPVFAQSFNRDLEVNNKLTLEEFSFGLIDGQADTLRGVYVPGAFALQIEYQPDGDPAYVSDDPGKVTLFNNAIEYGNIGILAHNTLSGRHFFDLLAGDEVWLVYGDGTLKSYMVTDVFQFQALDPENVYSDFVDLATGDTLSTSSVFHSMYGGDHHITFQTCIANEDSVSWGRLFVQAVPYSPNSVFTSFLHSLSWQ